MGWFWAQQENVKTKSEPVSECPVKHKAGSSSCPVDHSGNNPLNNMPYNLSTVPSPGQKVWLSNERSISSIPRGQTPNEGVWEYPSPQQMYNAMIRKGKVDSEKDAENVTPMVQIHNLLNEGAWKQILSWEDKYTESSKVEPRLLKFTGKPDELSPRARMMHYLGTWFPNSFSNQPPFDRHDWTVLRYKSINDDEPSQIRYVIDYYAGPDDFDGSPTFYLDVRPAIDNPCNAWDRTERWGSTFLRKALGRTGGTVND